MSLRFFLLVFFSCIFFFQKAQLVTAGFNAPDTVCVGQQFTIQNTTTGPANTYYWNFCLGNTNVAPTPTNMGNVGNFNGPVYYTIGKDGTNYYAFVSNNIVGTITRLFYGSSLINTPVATQLGNLGGVVPNNSEDIHLQLENGNWYGLMVGGGGFADKIIRLNFGNSLANIPTAVNMGNIGGLVYPQRLRIFSSGGNYYGFTPNAFGNTITRFSFGNSIANVPAGTNLGNIGGLSQPDDIAIISYGGNWYGYVVNEISNTLTRLSFGNSLLNTPTAVNLGNTGALNGPRGIDVYVECGQIKGLITNRYGNDLLNMNFTNGPAGPIITTSFGNIANFSFPHSITRFRCGDTLFAMIPNVSNNTLSRIYYPSCTNASIPSSTLMTPPAISYNTPGIYYISLTVNETQLNKSDYCKQVVAISPPTVAVTGSTAYCTGDSIKLYGSGPPGCTFAWQGPNSFTASTANIFLPNATTNNSGTYTLVVAKGACTSTLALKTITVSNGPIVNLGNDTNVCASPFSLTLNAGNPGMTYLWSGGQTTQTMSINTAGTYTVKVTNTFGCSSVDTISVTNNSLTVNIGNNMTLCPGTNTILNAGNPGAVFAWNTGQTTQSISIAQQGIYIVTVTTSGCVGSDTAFVLTPTISPISDVNACHGTLILLTASQGSSYQWSNGVTTQTMSPANSGTYWVLVNTSGCSLSDTINVVINPLPAINLGNDYSFCQSDIISVDLNAGNNGAAYLWNTGANTQSIHINSPGTYSVIVTLANGCSASDAITINRVFVSVNLGSDIDLCKGDTVSLNAGFGGSSFLWNTGETTQYINVATAGVYWTMVSNNGCSAFDSVDVTVNDPPVVDLGNDTTICAGEIIILSGGGSPDAYYAWSTGSSQPTIEITNPGYYSVVTTLNGCVVFDDIRIEECDYEIWTPNSFTPNGDGQNELFGPVCYNINKVTLMVFDRWGEMIFKGSGKDVRWDGKYKGKECQYGVYTYLLEYKIRSKLKQKTGSVTLIR
jgi:gliding motility-associated-like protein